VIVFCTCSHMPRVFLGTLDDKDVWDEDDDYLEMLAEEVACFVFDTPVILL
jgi:hypothetical protein